MTILESHLSIGIPILTDDIGQEILAVGRYKKDGAQIGQRGFDVDDKAVKSHDSDQSKALHPDWRESSGIALPTVEELHDAHHFLNRAAERPLKEASPASAPPPFKLSKTRSTGGSYGI